MPRLRKSTEITTTSSTNGLTAVQPLKLEAPNTADIQTIDLTQTLEEINAANIQQAILIGNALANKNNDTLYGALAFYQTNKSDTRYNVVGLNISSQLQASTQGMLDHANRSNQNLLAAMRDPSLLNQLFPPTEQETAEQE